jgi:succinate dehydrogenase / fumarate reductase flavoprotein subunit
MYYKIVDEDKTPMMIYPAVHYTMELVDYNLQTTIPGCFLLENQTSDHGANRLGASALMQGLADGYFVLPYTIGDYLSDIKWGLSLLIQSLRRQKELKSRLKNS